MSEQQFEDFLKRNARDYNAPPAETPRDAMWAAIAEARAAERRRGGAGDADGNGDAGGATVVPIATRRPLRRYAPWIGMAATLLIGFGIGRGQRSQAPATAVAVGTPATGPVAAAAPTSRDVAPSPVRSTVAAANPASMVATAATRRSTASRLPAATRAESNGNSFSIASREHLQRAEALVSVVAATPADAAMDSLTGAWARDMLTNTRLLLDSPAGDDPVRRRLLEDLETVLVQLIQRSGADADERALIDRTLQRTQLLTRLRSGAAGI